jgi:hypothetical protein
MPFGASRKGITMRDTTLPSPGPAASMGHNLRRHAAAAISSVEIVCGKTTGGKTAGAAQLQTFFTACATALNSFVDVAVPTVSSRVAASATQCNFTFNEAMDQTVLPPLSAFTSSGNTITAREWISATVLRLTGTGFAAGENMTYTRPATNYLRDLAGNAVATTSANMT